MASAFNYTVPSGFFAWDSLSPFVSDTISTSDTFSGILSPATASLTDTLVVSGIYPDGRAYTANVVDGLVSSEVLVGVGSGTPLRLFYGLVRETLENGGSSQDLLFDALQRASLISASSSSGATLNFDGIVRETLVGQSHNFTNIVIQTAYGSVPIFPTLPEGFPIKVSPVMDTTIGTTKSLREMRVAQQQFPLWDIEILFEELVDQTQNQVPYSPFVGYQQYMQLVQTWLMMYGQANVFGFDCPWDDSRQDQLIGVGDGSSYVFQIYRTWGTGANATTTPVGLVNAVVNVKVNNVVVNSGHYYIERDKIYFIDSLGFVYPPGNGLDITMTFSYYYLCRFVEDEQDFEEFSKDRWTVSSLKFRAVIWQ